jgi:hypothetical protein
MVGSTLTPNKVPLRSFGDRTIGGPPKRQRLCQRKTRCHSPCDFSPGKRLLAPKLSHPPGWFDGGWLKQPLEANPPTPGTAHVGGPNRHSVRNLDAGDARPCPKNHHVHSLISIPLEPPRAHKVSRAPDVVRSAPADKWNQSHPMLPPAAAEVNARPNIFSQEGSDHGRNPHHHRSVTRLDHPTSIRTPALQMDVTTPTPSQPAAPRSAAHVGGDRRQALR